MHKYKVVMMIPVLAEVEAYCHSQAVEMAVDEAQRKWYSNREHRPTVLSVEKLGVDNEKTVD